MLLSVAVVGMVTLPVYPPVLEVTSTSVAFNTLYCMLLSTNVVCAIARVVVRKAIIRRRVFFMLKDLAPKNSSKKQLT